MTEFWRRSEERARALDYAAAMADQEDQILAAMQQPGPVRYLRAERDGVIIHDGLVPPRRDAAPPPSAPGTVPQSYCAWKAEYDAVMGEPVGWPNETLLPSYSLVPAGACESCHRPPLAPGKHLCVYCLELRTLTGSVPFPLPVPDLVTVRRG